MSGLEDVEAFAAFLRALKYRSGRSYQALAVRLGVSDSALQRYCSGRQVPPDYGIVERFARECGADRDELRRARLLWSRADAARAEARAASAVTGDGYDDQAASGADPADADPGDAVGPGGAVGPTRASAWRRPALAIAVAAALVAGAVVGRDAGWWGATGSTRPPPVPEAASCAELAGAAGMAAWWPLDEDGQTDIASDSSARGVHAIRSSDADPVPGRFGRAVRFTGGSLRTKLPVVSTTRSFSVSAWVRLENTVDWATAVSQDGNRVSGFFLQYSYDDDRWSFAMVDSDADNAKGTRALSVTAPRTRQWTHLVGVHDAAARRLLLYVNGKLERNVAAPPPWPADGALRIGRARWNGVPADRWRGDIDDVCLFATALDAGHVRRLSAGKTPSASPRP